MRVVGFHGVFLSQPVGKNTFCFCLLLLQQKARITLVSSRRSSANLQNTLLDYFYGSSFISSIKTCHSPPPPPGSGTSKPGTAVHLPRLSSLLLSARQRQRPQGKKSSTPNEVQGAKLCRWFFLDSAACLVCCHVLKLFKTPFCARFDSLESVSSADRRCDRLR